MGTLQVRHKWALAAIAIVGLTIRVVLLPSAGFVLDIDQFVGSVGHIAHNGLAHAYDAPLSFGPVMAVVWWILGAFDPALVNAADSSDPAVRVVMKLPAIAADFAIAGFAWYALRHRPGWATIAVAFLLLHPAIWFVSAWWGTYDSVYVAFAAAAFVLAIRNHDAFAVVALILAVLTKPQAAPLLVPFAAWFMARAGWQGRDLKAGGRAAWRLAVLAGVALATLTVLWLPFLAAGGPANYLSGIGRYQGEVYAVLSISAWNPWWVIQEVVAGGKFIVDSSALVGGLTFRLMGYALTVVLLLGVAFCVARRPTPRVLALGLATAAFVAFEFLTTMHERYVFAVLPILVFVVDIPQMRRVIWIFGAVFLANLLSSTELYLGTIFPFHGPITVIGSFANIACLTFLLVQLLQSSRRPEPSAAINDA